MGDRAPFVVGILAIVAVVAWLVLRGDGAQEAPKPPPAPVARGSAAAINAPAGPSLGSETTPRPELPPAPENGPTAEDTFSGEDRDTAWATKTEAEITKRWKQVRGGKLESSECRQTQCRLIVAGTETDVATAIADLEGPRGLHGFAENVLLTNPARNADGTVTLSIYAKFDR
ncbi:MAG: hypothetical protein M4D80_35115 [Myxococcota bacterium]|nr:hypothetical protein [Deltaproteobacteria bacterium]MDQ3340418.1 hypothetical protein [Myxococcota bacterium]